MITQERLREVLLYDPLTGIFTWIVRTGTHTRVCIGGTAGTKDSYGYLVIRVDRQGYKAHRLAWLYMVGGWPDDQIDHINLDKTDNRWCNLREANGSQNHGNVGISKRNTSGFKGISLVQFPCGYRRWKGNLRANGKNFHLGYFDTPEAAHAAYCVAANKAFGEFARTA